MSGHKKVEEEEQEVPRKPLADPGALLSSQREKKGLSIAQMSRELGLTETAVRNLEQNLHNKFPAGIYVRGYIKNYCKVVELDPDMVMEALEEFITLNGTLASLGSNYDPLGAFGRKKKKMPAFVIPSLVAVGLLAIYIIYRLTVA